MNVRSKKALKYQGEIIGQYYFGGNKSNETEHRIVDISGNGNNLTPHGFAWTRESGWNQGGIYGDGIDDLITVTNNSVTKNNSKTPIFFKNALSNGYFAKVHIRKFLGFKEALTAEQIKLVKLVIDKYFK